MSASQETLEYKTVVKIQNVGVLTQVASLYICTNVEESRMIVVCEILLMVIFLRLSVVYLF